MECSHELPCERIGKIKAEIPRALFTYNLLLKCCDGKYISCESVKWYESLKITLSLKLNSLVNPLKESMLCPRHDIPSWFHLSILNLSKRLIILSNG